MASISTTKKAPAKKAAVKKVSAKKAVHSENSAFSVIATGGKQYIVRVGDVITIEKMDGEFTEGKMGIVHYRCDIYTYSHIIDLRFHFHGIHYLHQKLL